MLNQKCYGRSICYANHCVDTYKRQHGFHLHSNSAYLFLAGQNLICPRASYFKNANPGNGNENQTLHTLIQPTQCNFLSTKYVNSICTCIYTNILVYHKQTKTKAQCVPRYGRRQCNVNATQCMIMIKSCQFVFVTITFDERIDSKDTSVFFQVFIIGMYFMMSYCYK